MSFFVFWCENCYIICSVRCERVSGQANLKKDRIKRKKGMLAIHGQTIEATDCIDVCPTFIEGACVASGVVLFDGVDCHTPPFAPFLLLTDSAKIGIMRHRRP